MMKVRVLVRRLDTGRSQPTHDWWEVVLWARTGRYRRVPVGPPRRRCTAPVRLFQVHDYVMAWCSDKAFTIFKLLRVVLPNWNTKRCLIYVVHFRISNIVRNSTWLSMSVAQVGWDNDSAFLYSIVGRKMVETLEGCCIDSYLTFDFQGFI